MEWDEMVSLCTSGKQRNTHNYNSQRINCCSHFPYFTYMNRDFKKIMKSVSTSPSPLVTSLTYTMPVCMAYRVHYS